MESEGYVTDRATATAVYLAMTLRKPLLVEGHPGVGKTELAKVMARMLGTELIRLQCYEGLDVATSLYEWNYPKQLLHIKLEDHSGRSTDEKEAEIFSERFLLERPLLRAIRSTERSPVLLIDEIDRSDEEFEAFLLEVLSDYQVTIPEIGTIRAMHPPHVVLTSNRSRELHDALRRRCLYHWLDYPALAREVAIVRATLPQAEGALIEQAVAFVQRLRREDLGKTPGVAETLDWVRALHALRMAHLPDDPDHLMSTLGCLLKTRDDRFQIGTERVRQLCEGCTAAPGRRLI